MKVFYVRSLQDEGADAVFSTLEKAKNWLLDEIRKHSEDDNSGTDEWEGWAWWEHEGYLHFGGDSKKCPEGYVKEFEVL